MKKLQNIILVLVGIAFIALAFYYWLTAAGNLPHWVPGYEAGSSHKHTKHGLAALILGIGAFVLVWFNSGKKSTSASEE